jgi:exosortase A-associated hydrolase 2
MTGCGASHAAALPTFVQVGGRRIFVMCYGASPPAASDTAVLFVPPFGEEMNKSRRMVARLARSLANAGMTVLIPDLYGTGDSEGDFGEASWGIWCDDLAACAGFLTGGRPEGLVVWAMRTGALLAAAMLDSGRIQASRLLLWQPILNGDSFVNQLLRLRLAASLQEEGRRSTAAELRDRLMNEGALQVAGYCLSKELLLPLGRARLEEMVSRPPGGVLWLELGGILGRGLGPSSQRLIEHWRSQGMAVRADVVEGPPFWATQEIAEVPALLERTLSLLHP